MHIRITCIAVITCALSLLSCGNNTNKQKKEDPFHARFDSIIQQPRKDTSIKTEAVIPDTTTKEVPTPLAKDTAKADSTTKYVFLTFDDGPQQGTMNVYHNLRALNIDGTFFMVGLHATYGKLMREAVDTIRNAYPDILLANHSYDHARDKYIAFYQHPRTSFESFTKNQKDLAIEKKIVRLPGNSAWVLGTGMLAHPLVKPVCKLLDSAGYNVIGWDVEWNFKADKIHHSCTPVQTPETMVKMIEYALNHHRTHRRNAVVLLAHDRMFHQQNYSDSLYKFMYLLKTRHPEYVFQTVEHYPGVKKGA